MSLFDKIILLPDEIKDIVKTYLTYSVTIRLSKSHCVDFFPLYLRITRFPYLYACTCVFTKYIKHLLKKDLDFIVEFLIKEYGSIWSKNKKIRYKKISFSNYIEFLLYLCIEKYKATKCRNKIYEIMGNKYKNNRLKLYNNEWNN
tara:strand:- start:32 stop:466 length:435 start_codon:yes stop_codon:yes gene_type:complete